ncbi:STAS/SEC14 domain-containing protein [Alteromonas sp. CYL-A6]|uniref:STAS/SEC14 domain-containing protein n=1 Tax=Alteromonas nitratireducens TaxID=3390813 RepID=UPI0034ABB408
MTITHRHGLSIGIEREDSDFFVTMKAIGTLTHADYETITPMLDAALAEVKTPHIRMFLDATEFEGWEARAAWDDFKLGLKHGREFDKIAIYGSKPWHKLMATIGNWFVSGKVEFFDDIKAAMQWLNSQ